MPAPITATSTSRSRFNAGNRGRSADSTQYDETLIAVPPRPRQKASWPPAETRVRTLRTGTSFWLDQAAPASPPFRKLRGDHQADVAIVGGGITGCACAYMLAKAGVRVTLFEAGEIGRGSTAASTALLMHETDVDFMSLAQKYGPAVARAIWHASRHAVKGLTTALRELDRDLPLTELPSLYLSMDERETAGLQREVRARRRAGIPARWLSPARLQATAGVRGAGAIITPGDAQTDPYRACVAFATAARDHGASLHPRSRVGRIHTSRDGVRLDVDGRRVSAAKVIVATGYATPDFKRLLRRFRMYNTYVIATPRLPARVRAAVGLGEVMWWDTNRPYHYARWTPDGRLICSRSATAATA
ncbi:MAG TPA: FAD-dependent oxidoreductase [Vicinamibacterales bacterium]|nr:FAD-dependent oxidoreductase [Vicinamibacterales bacterium]